MTPVEHAPAGHRRHRLAGVLAPAVVLALVLGLPGCDGDGESRPEDDPHVVQDGRDLEEDPETLSPPILSRPIYACASAVQVSGFVPGAEIEIFADGASVGQGEGWLSSGQGFETSVSFTEGQVVTAVQTVDGQTSPPSNAVTVTSHTEDYPDGLPKPRMGPLPCYDCGRALGYRDVVPGAWVSVLSESPASGGGFEPPVEIGRVNSASSSSSYLFVSPAFEEDARIRVESGLCADESPPSDATTVEPEPADIPVPSLDPVHEGTSIVVAWGSGGSPEPLLNGARVDVFADDQPPGDERVGGQPTPGGGQQIRISPPASSGANYTATQALCSESDPSDPVPVVPCEDLPPAEIEAPLPGDTRVELTEYVPGSRILVFADGEEVGDGGGPVVALTRPIQEGETVRVVQRMGDCTSGWVYEIDVECGLGGTDQACSGEWPAFRHNGLRNGRQARASALSDPYRVRDLSVRWSFTPPEGRAFRASPIVWNDRVYIGNGNGYLYALDAATGDLLWQYPSADEDPLDSQFHSNPSSFGIASSAAIATIQEVDAVIFGAPDPSIGAGLGSGRLFALNAATGDVIWRSPEIAVLDGLTSSTDDAGASLEERHEQIGYSSPLVFRDRVYIGIANHGDNPIQNGRVVAVDLGTGNVVGAFSFQATDSRGGGVWSSVAGGLEGRDVYITTGNTRCWNGGCQPEPSPNHGLSFLRLDATSGAIDWKLQPVPYPMDADPDWAAGPTLTSATCGDVALSTMKDGWAYAVDATDGGSGSASVRWQFPPTSVPFSPGDGTVHGDSRYLVPGAAWDEVYVTMAGGWPLERREPEFGFSRLHALNVCAGSRDRVRWIADVPGTVEGREYNLGPPTVADGIVFVGTRRGHLVALADPSVWATAESRCSDPDVSVGDCAANGFQVIPEPVTLLDLDLDVSAPSDRILTEPVLAGGRVFVATGGGDGTVYMLEPER